MVQERKKRRVKVSGNTRKSTRIHSRWFALSVPKSALSKGLTQIHVEQLMLCRTSVTGVQRPHAYKTGVLTGGNCARRAAVVSAENEVHGSLKTNLA